MILPNLIFFLCGKRALEAIDKGHQKTRCILTDAQKIEIGHKNH